MAEYIEREAAIEAVTVWYKKACRPENMSSYNIGERAAYTTAISEIAKLHAADVRPVVLCRDCKYAPIGDKDGSDLEWLFNDFDGNPCPYKCSDNWYSHKPAPDFFCAAGKKMEGS